MIRDLAAADDDLTPRIAAAQIIGVVRVLSYEARRRLLAGEQESELRTSLARAAQHAFDRLAAELGDYGIRTEIP